MRRIAISLLVLLALSAKLYAKVELDTVQRVQAIVAYEINLLSLEAWEANVNNKDSAKSVVDEFKQRAKNAKTVDQVEHCLNNDFTKNKRICNTIQGERKEFTSKVDLGDYYTKAIFDVTNGELGNFLKKLSSDDLKKLKENVKRGINVLLTNQAKAKSAPTATQPKSKNIVNTLKTFPRNNAKQNVNTSNDSENKGGKRKEEEKVVCGGNAGEQDSNSYPIGESNPAKQEADIDTPQKGPDGAIGNSECSTDSERGNVSTRSRDGNTSPAPLEEENEGLGTRVLVFSLVIAVLLGMAAYLILQLKKIKKLVAQQENEIHEATALSQELQHDRDAAIQEITLLQTKNKQLKNAVEELHRTIERMQQGERLSAEAAATERDAPKTIQNAAITTAQLPTIYFASIPVEGAFSDVNNEYKQGTYIYRIETMDGLTGQFEFINDSETIWYANQSRSAYVEPACYIVNAVSGSFKEVKTLEKGTVEKRDCGWKITSKARVSLV